MNVDIYDIRECVQVIAPDRINDLRAREHAAGMAHQVLQQGKLFGRQFDDTTGTTRFVPHEVERQIAHRELEGLIKTTVAAAEEGVNARQQFLHGEGLGQVVISPHVETRHTILDCTTRCEHQHRRAHHARDQRCGALPAGRDAAKTPGAARPLPQGYALLHSFFLTWVPSRRPAPLPLLYRITPGPATSGSPPVMQHVVCSTMGAAFPIVPTSSTSCPSAALVHCAICCRRAASIICFAMSILLSY